MASPSLKRKRHRITAPISTTTSKQEPKNSNNRGEDVSPLLGSDFIQTIRLVVTRFGLGLIGAVHACAVLTALMVVAVVLGFGMVTMWAEEPVFVRESVYFDYVEAHPVAVVRFGKSVDGWEMEANEGVPVGHSFSVQLVLLLPESDFNQEIGIFQVLAELISTNGNVIARTSQPCMLKFRSLPVRLMRTFLMGVPLSIGLTSETQKIVIPILKHKEKVYPRTEAIKVTLIPRSGTHVVPQIYEAEIILNSKLPWKKEIVWRWKWTFCIWTTLYIYTLLVVVLLCRFRHVIFPCYVEVERHEERDKVKQREEVDEREIEDRLEDREVSEMLRRWRRRRSKRKAMVGILSDTLGPSSASSTSLISEEIPFDSAEFSVEDSESVCFGG